MSKDDVISSLKSCIDVKYHDLNDWDSIYENRVLYDEDINLYKCSFVDLYIHDDGEFFTADPHIPPSHDATVVDSFSDDESAIIDELKKCLDPKDYDLNDWGSILNNKVVVDDLTMYDLSFCKVYLDKDNNFYDVEPVEVDDAIDILTKNCSSEELSTIASIKLYVPSKYYDLINWSIILKRVEEVEDNIYHYPLTVMDLYLDKDYKPVNYKRCHIIDGDFYYDFNPQDIVTDGQLTYITSIKQDYA